MSLWLSFGVPNSEAIQKPVTLTVIATTDFHGALEPETIQTVTNEHIELGGAALLATYVKRLRENAPGPSLVIDAGDLFQGSLASNLAEGKPVIAFYNSLNISAAALGNHEFDYGPIGAHSVPLSPEDDPQGALKERIKEARFPVLAANVYAQDGSTPAWLKRSVIYDFEGLRVGIIGAATPNTPNTTVRANLTGLRFENPLASVVSEATALRSQHHADVVILAFHGGGSCANNSPSSQNDLSTCVDDELFSLVKSIPKGLIDVVVGGHTHQGIAKQIEKTSVLQTYSHGKYVGWAEVRVDKDGARSHIAGFEPVCSGVVSTPRGQSCAPSAIRASTLPVKNQSFLGAVVKPDPETLELIAPYLEHVRKIKDAPLGIRALTEFTRSYKFESALGNLTADSIRAAINRLNLYSGHSGLYADVAVTNGGGLRANVDPGPIRYGQIYEVLPFDNRVAILSIEGAILRKIVALGVNGAGGGLAWSNLTFTADGCTVTNIEVDGKPLDDVRVYKVATNDYLAGGGSGFDRVGLDPSQVRVLWDGSFILRDVLAEQLKAWGRDIKSEEFYAPNAPRQRLQGTCK